MAVICCIVGRRSVDLIYLSVSYYQNWVFNRQSIYGDATSNLAAGRFENHPVESSGKLEAAN
jgi:hypothetical protein